MCGISGTINFDPDRIVDLIHHQEQRGPDDSGIFKDELITLGHNRLAVLDLSSNGGQPMATGRYVLVYNGEIYNYKAMQSTLYTLHNLELTGNDAETLLMYIEKEGLYEALDNANGMYAFALYDRLEAKLHLVTDRLGQKPLYYYQSGNQFAFASSVGALLQLRGTWAIDPLGLQSYWSLGSTFGEHTLISGIYRIGCSTVMSYDIHKALISKAIYWQPEHRNQTDYIEEIILQAINDVKVSDVPVYLFLSGGIDSTLVASQFHNYNAVHLDSPEKKFANMVARKFNINLAVASAEGVDIVAALMDYALQTGEPSGAALIPYITAKKISRLAKVAIIANGADELFFGYDRTSERVTSQQVDHIFRKCIKGATEALELNLKFDNDTANGRLFELQTFVQFDLNKTLDAASMCHGLEVRSPFLDHRVIELALSIPMRKHIDSVYGRKAILKRMLHKMGFNHEFLTRPKVGFSFHYEPENFEQLKNLAWKFCIECGYLKIDSKVTMTERDRRYLEMAALSFYYWLVTWENKLCTPTPMTSV